MGELRVATFHTPSRMPWLAQWLVRRTDTSSVRGTYLGTFPPKSAFLPNPVSPRPSREPKREKKTSRNSRAETRHVHDHTSATDHSVPDCSLSRMPQPRP